LLIFAYVERKQAPIPIELQKHGGGTDNLNFILRSLTTGCAAVSDDEIQCNLHDSVLGSCVRAYILDKLFTELLFLSLHALVVFPPVACNVFTFPEIVKTKTEKTVDVKLSIIRFPFRTETPVLCFNSVDGWVFICPLALCLICSLFKCFV